MGSVFSSEVPSTKERTIRALMARYPDLNRKKIRLYMARLPSEMHFWHIRESMRFGWPCEACNMNVRAERHMCSVRKRLMEYFHPLTPLKYLEKCMHLTQGGQVDQCRLLFHLFCHTSHLLRQNELSKKQQNSISRHHMSLQEFQQAIDLLVKKRIERSIPQASPSDKFVWLFQMADVYNLGYITLPQFAKIIMGHPILKSHLHQLVVPLWNNRSFVKQQRKQQRRSKRLKMDGWTIQEEPTTHRRRHSIERATRVLHSDDSDESN